jgi:HEAT repeat protein
MVPKDDRFVTEMITTFEYAINDRDIRIRQFLAIAMGATGDKRYVDTIIKALDQNDNEIIMACAYALGNLKDNRAVKHLLGLLDSGDPQIRLQAVIALGKIDNRSSTLALEKMLADIEPNVRWDAAIALAKQKNSSGRRIILDLLDRKYLDSFSNIDKIEQVQAMMVAINVAPLIQNSDLKQSLLKLRESDLNLKIREAARIALLNFEE